MEKMMTIGGGAVFSVVTIFHATLNNGRVSEVVALAVLSGVFFCGSLFARN
jgi:hypothetical protein